MLRMPNRSMVTRCFGSLLLLALLVPAGAVDLTLGKMGLRPPTPDEQAWMDKNLVVTTSVAPNELAMERRAALRGPSIKNGFITLGGPVGAPASVDNSKLKYFPPVSSQGGIGSCAQFSSVYYTMSHMTAMARGFDMKSDTDMSHKFSPKFTYALVNGGGDNGSWFQPGLLQRHGCPTWKEWPYSGDGSKSKNYTEWPTTAAIWQDAINYRMDQAGVVNQLDTQAGLDNLKALLANGYLLNYATGVSSWQYGTIKSNPGNPNIEVGKAIVTFMDGNNGGHGMTICGYNDDIWVDLNGNGTVDTGELGALKIVNSWGTGWGNDGGFMYIAYDALKAKSAVVGGPSTTSRQAIFWYNSAYWMTAPPAQYAPKSLAYFTLNTADRGSMSVVNGIATDPTQPTKITWWDPQALNWEGGGMAFDGGTTAIDGNFCFDFSNIFTPDQVGHILDLKITDGTGGNPLTCSDFHVVDVAKQQTFSCATTPATVDRTNQTLSIYYYIGPVSVSLDNTVVADQAPANTTVGKFSTVDANPGQTFTYTLVNGSGSTDNGKFKISGDTLTLTTPTNGSQQSSYSIRVQVVDTKGLSMQTTFTITVDFKGTPSDITLSNTVLADQSPANSTVGKLTTTDPNTGQTFTYSLVTGTGSADNSKFSFLGGDTLIVAGQVNGAQQASYNIRLQTTDTFGYSFQKAFVITVDYKGSPTDIALSNATLADQAPAFTAVGNLTTTDPNAGQTFTYALVNGTGSADNGKFAINGDKLTITAPTDGKTQSTYTVRIQTTDTFGYTFAKAFSITVDYKGGPSDIALSNSVLADLSPANTTVGKFTSTDPNPGQTFTYKLVTGTGDDDNAKFAINTDTLSIAVAVDGKTQASYSIRVQTTDKLGYTYQKVFAITVNYQGGPTNISLSNSVLADLSPANTTVGTLTSTDPSPGQTFTYALVTGTGSTDNGSFKIAGDQLVITTSTDGSVKSSYSVRIQTTNTKGRTYQKAFTITVSYQGAPTDIQLSNSIIADQAPATTTVGKFTTTDPNPGQTFTYNLVAGTGDDDNLKFSINGDTLVLMVTADGSVQPSYSVRVQTMDTKTYTFSKAFKLSVNYKGGPININLSNSVVPDLSPAGVTVGQLTTVDPNPGQTFIYSLVAGSGDTDNTKFSLVNGDNLVLGEATDSTVQSTYTVRVQSVDKLGYSLQKALTVTVPTPNAPPVIVVPPDPTTPMDKPVTFTGASAFSISDPAVGTGAVKVWLFSTHGTLKLAKTANLTFDQGHADNSANPVFTGKLVDVNAALDGLTFTPRLHYVGAALVQVSCSDLGPAGARPQIGSGGALVLNDYAQASVWSWGDDAYGQIDTPSGSGTIGAVQAAAGGAHSVAIKSGGTSAAWGANEYGQLNVAKAAILVAAGGWQTLTLKGTHALSATGYNGYGATTVPSNLGAVIGVASGENHSLAIKANGSVAAWGCGTSGQIAVPANMLPVAMVAGGAKHSVALLADGSVVCWGDNYYGQCSVPSNLTGVIAVAAGRYHTVALKADGSVTAWGCNNNGECNVPSTKGNLQIAAGGGHTLVLTGGNTVYATGLNSSGQTDVPAQLAKVMSVAAGGAHSLAVTDLPPLTGPAPGSSVGSSDDDLTGVALIASPVSAARLGTTVTLTAVAQTKGNAGRIEYRFVWSAPNGRQLATGQLSPWGSSDTCVWTPEVATRYRLTVYARRAGSAKEVLGTLPFDVRPSL